MDPLEQAELYPTALVEHPYRTLDELIQNGLRMEALDLGASVQRSSRRVGPIAEYSPRPRCPEDWPIAQFSREAEELLQQLGDQVYDTFQGRTDVDVEFSQGVLTLRFPNGTFVLNTQTPNRQIWLSSPLSGPARYYYDLDTGKWRNSRDDHMLVDRLQKDLAVFTGCNIQLNL